MLGINQSNIHLLKNTLHLIFSNGRSPSKMFVLTTLNCSRYEINFYIFVICYDEEFNQLADNLSVKRKSIQSLATRILYCLNHYQWWRCYVYIMLVPLEMHRFGNCQHILNKTLKDRAIFHSPAIKFQGLFRSLWEHIEIPPTHHQFTDNFPIEHT